MDSLYNEPEFSVLFLILGCILLFLEIFVPSGGILGILAVASAGFGVFGFFHQDDPITALASFGGFLVYSGLILYFVLKRVSFKGALYSETSSSVDERIDESLLGQTGLTLTPLRPAGQALINSKKVDVVSVGEFVDKSVSVQVVDISGNRVVVRETEGRS